MLCLDRSLPSVARLHMLFVRFVISVDLVSCMPAQSAVTQFTGWLSLLAKIYSFFNYIHSTVGGADNLGGYTTQRSSSPETKPIWRQVLSVVLVFYAVCRENCTSDFSLEYWRNRIWRLDKQSPHDDSPIYGRNCLLIYTEHVGTSRIVWVSPQELRCNPAIY